MKNIKILVVIFTLPLLLTISCENVSESYLKEKITNENLISLTEKVSNDKHTQLQDIEYIISYLSNYSVYRDSILGKTFEEIINSQRNKEVQSKKITLTQLAKKTVFNHAFAIVLDSITAFDEVGKQPVNLFTYQMSNMGQKAIKQVEGFIEFHDAQGLLIKKYGVNMQYDLEPGRTITQQFPYNYDANNPRDIYIRENYKNVLTIWIPVKITYSDGSVLDLSLNL